MQGGAGYWWLSSRFGGLEVRGCVVSMLRSFLNMLVEQDEQRKGCLVCEDLVREAGRTKVMLMGQVVVGLEGQKTEAGLHSTE